MLIIRVPAQEYSAKSSQLLDFLEKKLPKGRIDSIAENNDESVISYSFIHLEKSILLELKNELKNIASNATSNIFFNRSGDV